MHLLSVILGAFSSADSCQHAGCEHQMKGFLCRPVHVIHIICMRLGLVAYDIVISRQKVSVQPCIWMPRILNVPKCCLSIPEVINNIHTEMQLMSPLIFQANGEKNGNHPFKWDEFLLFLIIKDFKLNVV